VSLKVTKDGLGELRKRLAKLVEHQVLVGIPADNADRLIDPDEQDKGPINNAALGYIHENGSPAANIPARPWLKPGVADAKEEIVKRYRTGAKAILNGQIQDPEKVHRAVGLVAEAAVKRKITGGDFTPLAPSTIAKRRAKGRKSEKPLTDTGQLRNAVTSVVRERK
jgi:hypothetical protein